ncbi:TPA: O-antigen translocase [Escherichia albertii]|uniref:O-antigen flippase n=2 Tax=Escherichia albertii TaxID=208962 RepID=A0A5A4U3N1_ESCAL|nr:O-antigen translocase [Escherichia albertii]EHG7532429.1 O-antigen translocase [Escherichia albertii]MCV3253491.1 O-antigen translocase [Escherichia albertii]MCV3268773.1 O-antigen translocase [Escherichia albertii]BBM62391.1 O-antigen flippase [Escherichia albertii]
MNMFKTAILSLISTIFKLLSALIINKVISIFVGPAGIALIGQFQNLIQMVNTLSQGGMLSGVTKYTAEYNKHSPENIEKLWSTAFKIIVLLSIILGFLLIVLSKALSSYLFGTQDYYIFIRFLGCSTIFTSLNGFVLAVINGLKKIKLYVLINIYQSLISLMLSTLLVMLYGLKGAFLALILNQSIIFVTLLFIFNKNGGREKVNKFIGRASTEELKKLFSFSLMAITSAIVGPVSLMLIRNFIQENINLNASGYWQSMWYISSMYLLVITTTLSIYYLPRLSELVSTDELKVELIKGIKIIVPLVATASFLVYLLKDFIISILFTPEFSNMRDLFRWQVCGDVLKITAWLFSYVLIAKAQSKAFIILEVINFSLFTVLSIVMIHTYGLIGGSYGYFFSNLIYLILVSIVVKVRFFKNYKS